jgi:hypothetical protein
MTIYKKLFMHEQDYVIGNYREIAEAVFYSAAAFLVPFFLGHSQLVTGVIVNIALVLAALNLRNEKLLPVIFLPSLGALSRGLIFGPFTMYLAYMIPFIWLGNFLLVYAVKRLSVSGNKNRFLALGIGAAVKSAFIFAGAFTLFSLAVIPQALLVPMGIMQFATAAIGGSIAIGMHRLKKQISLQ